MWSMGEIAGLLWRDLDLERGFVTVSRTVEEDDDGTLLEYPPKNGKARTVPLPAAACEELRVSVAAQKEYRLAQALAGKEAGRVVPKKDGAQMAPSTLKSQWWNWVARQKVDPHPPIHGLRDSFGTRVYAPDPEGQGCRAGAHRHSLISSSRGIGGASPQGSARDGVGAGRSWVEDECGTQDHAAIFRVRALARGSRLTLTSVQGAQRVHVHVGRVAQIAGQHTHR